MILDSSPPASRNRSSSAIGSCASSSVYSRRVLPAPLNPRCARVFSRSAASASIRRRRSRARWILLWICENASSHWYSASWSRCSGSRRCTHFTSKISPVAPAAVTTSAAPRSVTMGAPNRNETSYRFSYRAHDGASEARASPAPSATSLSTGRCFSSTRAVAAAASTEIQSKCESWNGRNRYPPSMASYQLASFRKSRTCVGGLASVSRICRTASTSSTMRSARATRLSPDFRAELCAAFASSCRSIFASELCRRLASEVVCALSAWRVSGGAPRVPCLCSCAATTARPVMSETDSMSPAPARLGTLWSIFVSTLGGSTATGSTASVASRMVCSGRNFTRSVTANDDAGTGIASAGGLSFPHFRTSSHGGRGTPHFSNAAGSSRRNGSFPPSSCSPTT